MTDKDSDAKAALINTSSWRSNPNADGYTIPNDDRISPSDIQPGTDLSEANLSGADLSGADLSEANLRRAGLTNASLQSASLQYADLRGAGLFLTAVVGTDLSHADLRGADLSDADLSHADLSGSNLSGTILSGADLSNANLTRADLSGADLTDTTVINTDVTDADCSGVSLNTAELDNMLESEEFERLSVDDSFLSILSRTVQVAIANVTSIAIAGVLLFSGYLRGIRSSKGAMSASIAAGISAICASLFISQFARTANTILIFPIAICLLLTVIFGITSAIITLDIRGNPTR
jgi:hypothetical protein